MAEARAARPEGLAAYVAVTGAYWAFMLTDGALRMLVLLHFNRLGFSPVQLAYLFLLYEIAGIVTNLCAGWIAARFGLTSTLYAGLALQVGALLALAQLDPAWAVASSVVSFTVPLSAMATSSLRWVLLPLCRGHRWGRYPPTPRSRSRSPRPNASEAPAPGPDRPPNAPPNHPFAARSRTPARAW